MNETWWVNESDLDDDQRKVIGLGRDGCHFIIGPPGSGKTNLLLLRANYLCTAGRPNVMILVFTRNLREFIVSGASRYSFSSKKVQTYHGWARRLLREHGVELEQFNDFEEDRKYLLNHLQTLIADEIITDQYYDAILLDEAHDYLIEEIEVIRRFSKNLFAVADSRQQIYKRDSKLIEYLKSITEPIELKYHYRNGLKICQLADSIMKGKNIYSPLEPTSHYDETVRPSSVKYFKCSNISEQGDIIVAELETQLQAYPGEYLGIICPRHKELELIKNILSLSWLKHLCVFQDPNSGYAPFDSGHSICISTLHGAKGLEFRALHLVACDTLRNFHWNNRNMAFTGVTRAKTSLSIYHIDSLHGYFERALAALFPRSDCPDISEAFGKGD